MDGITRDFFRIRKNNMQFLGLFASKVSRYGFTRKRFLGQLDSCLFLTPNIPASIIHSSLRDRNRCFRLRRFTNFYIQWSFQDFNFDNPSKKEDGSE